MPATRVVVNIPGEDAYNVRVGAGVLDALGSSMRGVPVLADARQVLVITDANVGPLYLARAKASLAQAGYRVSDICVPAGEEAKSLTVLGEVLEAMAALALERDCVVVALGGGCVGDLAGFAAATYMRGVQVVQVPTTLLSMVDSSVGGKTGVNLSAGKNLVGAFKQPAFVCADTEVLATLPAREWACGCGEVAKTALIDGDEFFFWLSDQASAVVDRQPDAVSEVIARCVVFKADVVAQDKTESRGVRECLNYGHTLAHAIEKLSGYGTYSHGHAVAEGMRFAARMGMRLADMPVELAQAQGQLLDDLGLPELGWEASPAQVLDVMKRDKKARHGQVRFVCLHDVGQWRLQDVANGVILEELEAYFAQKRR